MNNTNSANPFASPKQLSVPSAPSIGDPIQYECTPTIDDLNIALRSTSLIVYGFIFVLILGLVFIAVVANLISGQIEGIQYWISLVVGLSLIHI